MWHFYLRVRCYFTKILLSLWLRFTVYRANWFRFVWFGCQYICAAANRSNATFHTRIIVNKMIRKRIRTTKYKFVRGRSRCCFSLFRFHTRKFFARMQIAVIIESAHHFSHWQHFKWMDGLTWCMQEFALSQFIIQFYAMIFGSIAVVCVCASFFFCWTNEFGSYIFGYRKWFFPVLQSSLPV